MILIAYLIYHITFKFTYVLFSNITMLTILVHYTYFSTLPLEDNTKLANTGLFSWPDQSWVVSKRVSIFSSSLLFLSLSSLLSLPLSHMHIPLSLLYTYHTTHTYTHMPSPIIHLRKFWMGLSEHDDDIICSHIKFNNKRKEKREENNLPD